MNMNNRFYCKCDVYWRHGEMEEKIEERSATSVMEQSQFRIEEDHVVLVASVDDLCVVVGTQWAANQGDATLQIQLKFV